MKRVLLNIGVILAIIVVGGGIAMVGMAMRSSPSDAEIVSDRRPTNVKVQILDSMTVDDELSLMGTLEPWEDVTLSAKTVGEIEWQDVEEGDTVEAGQDLMRIDSKAVQVALDQARAQHKLTVRELERTERMSEEGISSPQQRDRALVDFEVASTNLRAAEINVEDSVIKAKFAGVVDTLHEEEGEFVSAGKPLLRLVQLDHVKLVIGIPERDVGYFSVGDEVEVSLDAIPGRSFEGTIFRISATGERATHTFVTEVTLDNADGALKPGMIAKARLVRASFPDSVMVPLFALVTSEAGRHAVVDDGGVARVRPVELGLLKGNLIHVTTGLVPGERLIVLGQRELRDGDQVAVREVIQ